MIVGSAVFSLSAQAGTITKTFAQWQAAPVTIGDKLFTYGTSSNLPTSPTDTVSFIQDDNNTNQYFLNYNFVPPSSITAFTLDYTVDVVQSDPNVTRFFKAVDSDTTVSTFPPAETLVTNFVGNTPGSSVTLTSIGGSPEVSLIGGAPTSLAVSNTYTSGGAGGGPITSFQNSFLQDARINTLSTPEPTSMVGLLVFGGLGLASKLKKRSR